MKPRTFFYNVRQGFKSVFRHSVMSTASMLVLVVCMVLVGSFYLIIDTIDLNFKNINMLNVIEVRLNKSYTEEQIGYIGDKLTEIRNKSSVIEEEVLFVSAEEHLEIMRQQYGENAWFDDIVSEDNPLRPSFRLTFVNLSDADEVSRVKYQIEAITFEDGTKAINIDDIKDYIDLYDNVMSIKNALYIVGAWVMIILLAFSLFVITNTIRLGVFARREEIRFMRLCGATRGFVRMPFIVQGIIIGIISAGIAFGIEFYLYEYLLKDLVSSVAGGMSGNGIIIAPFSEYVFILAAGYLGIGLFAGVISSGISINKYLNQ